MKPECEEALRDIERFLDEEMGPPQRQKLDSHLHECSPCMQRADFKRQVKDLVASRCGCDELPAHLKEEILRMLHEPPRTPAPGA
ncbi:MAG: mycothiol system anti-sigma-R factor [Actinobacteria bacterium]|nr:mycothiol system anti-sigma-R factor [Actinomycetota bacterium]